MSSEVPAVIAGLAVGIALIVIFVSYTRPGFTMSTEEIIEKTRSLPEVQAFYERYPEPEPNVGASRVGMTTEVYYQRYQIFYTTEDVPDRTVKELRLTITIDPFGKMTKGLECGSSLSYGMPATVENIKTNTCLEHL